MASSFVVIRFVNIVWGNILLFCCELSYCRKQKQLSIRIFQQICFPHSEWFCLNIPCLLTAKNILFSSTCLLKFRQKTRNYFLSYFNFRCWIPYDVNFEKNHLKRDNILTLLIPIGFFADYESYSSDINNHHFSTIM